ncbi:MAG: hypothetical protein WCR52_21700 [Bacteroidota bacterium]
MTIEINEQDLALLYYKTKQKYKECIDDSENSFLEDEAGVPFDSIKLIEKDIKIIFYKDIASNYLFEVSLLLYAGDKEIGKYTFIESETGNAIDDILVLY